MDTVPGRMGFLLTLVLCKINLLNTTVVNSPRSGGQPTAIVQWILFCLFFTTMAIFEYAMILTYKKYSKPASVLVESMSGPTDKNKMGELFKWWDKIMVVILPSTFTVFAITFWVVHYHL